MPPRKKAAAPRAAPRAIPLPALQPASRNANKKRNLEQDPQDAPNAKRTNSGPSTTELATSDDSSDDESESEPEVVIDWEARWKERDAQRAREAEQEKQPWPTDITGEWTISCSNSDKYTSSSMSIYYEDGQATAGRRQYYADFKMSSNWHGTMRFCPAGQVDFEGNGELSVEDFEKACILKDGVKAGPPPHGVHDFAIKWRGFFTDPSMPERWNQPRPRDDFTTSIKFKLGEDGKMVASFILLEGSIVMFFKGVRIGDGEPRGLNEPTIEEIWEEKKFKAPPPPPPPKLWPWNSPLPTPKIEAPPTWAWDVLGKWEITAGEVATALKVEKGASMSMTVHLANDPKNKKIGRQLWATFNFGQHISGCMRFCPLPQESRPAHTVAKFEKLCVLKNGIWPGDSASKPENSFQKWGYRWRALDNRGKDLTCSDTVEHMFEFKRDDDGTLKLRGVFGAIWLCCLWSAVKVEDGDSKVGADVNTVWNSYKRR